MIVRIVVSTNNRVQLTSIIIHRRRANTAATATVACCLFSSLDARALLRSGGRYESIDVLAPLI
jgi:hypothetical protein